MRVPDELLDCVYFLCVDVGRPDAHVMKYGGTGFFVSIRSEVLPETQFVYLVTARHCVEKAKNYGPLYLRLNTRDGGAKFIEIDMEWYYPDNDASDVAVLPFAPNTEMFQYRHIQEGMWLTEERIAEHRIGVGDDLYVIGLFTERYGRQRNSRIVRTGILAGMPDENLQDENSGLDYRAYLAEVRSIGGLSGSPVFVFLHPGRVWEGTVSLDRKAFLLGIIRGHWDYRKRMEAIDYAADELDQVNMGIATVTPIQDALDIINGEDLVKQRRQVEREMQKEHAPVLDSAVIDSDETAGEAGITREEFQDALRKASRRVKPDDK
jgi:hypothetical protein